MAAGQSQRVLFRIGLIYAGGASTNKSSIAVHVLGIAHLGRIASEQCGCAWGYGSAKGTSARGVRLQRGVCMRWEYQAIRNIKLLGISYVRVQSRCGVKKTGIFSGPVFLALTATFFEGFLSVFLKGKWMVSARVDFFFG